MNFVVILSKKFAEPLVVQTEIKDYLTGMKVERNALLVPLVFGFILLKCWYYMYMYLTPCPDQNS